MMSLMMMMTTPMMMMMMMTVAHPARRRKKRDSDGRIELANSDSWFLGPMKNDEGMNGFLGAVHKAFKEHKGVRFKPIHFENQVIQQIAIHISTNPEKYRHLLTTTQPTIDASSGAPVEEGIKYGMIH